ncbi:cyclic nucleotide-binding domain-containing protein [Pseudahrensia aquimaris]|uniref:Cyclic nucleotide-binding domain-containing protein n=1 Tax=Pseudahrensia aquimaris TaxID=744461 RepID=A0ABW3FI80_9HYPH
MSKLQDEVDLLRSIPMFANLAANKLKLLAFASDRVSYSEGEVLFEQGDEADAAYVVISGEADILVTTGDTVSKVAVLGPNEFVGDMAILCDIQRTATVKANSPMEALRIRKEHLNELINDTPALAMSVLKELVQRLAKTTKDLSEANEEIQRLKAG